MGSDEVKRFMRLLNKAGENKQSFLNYLQELEIHLDDPELYEEIISWTDDEAKEFLKYWDWNLNWFEYAIWEFSEKCANKKNDLALREQDHSLTKHSQANNTTVLIGSHSKGVSSREIN